MSVVQTRIRTRALRLRRALLKEEEEHGFIDDGAGKRYIIGPLFVQCRDIQAALNHFQWYEEHCPDDSGDPIHYIFWALALHRSGMIDVANTKLLESMIQNIYQLPIILGLPYKIENIWHSSNLEEPTYILEAPPEFVPILTEDERGWMVEQWKSERFTKARGEYVTTFGALKNEVIPQKRREILDRWYEFKDKQINLAG